METSEVLYTAADLIERRGWTTGTGWTNDDGEHPLCVEGAVAAAMGERGGPGFRCPAYDAVAAYVGRSPWLWNDHLPYQQDEDGYPSWEGYLGGGSFEQAIALGRQQVIETLRAAAVIEAAKERAATEPPLTSEDCAVRVTQ